VTRRPPAWVLALLLAGSPLPARAGDGDGKGKEAKKEKPAAPEPYRAGDEVKDLALDLVAGGKWTAEGARKKVTLLVFAGAAGGWSKESLDALKRLPAVAKRYAGKGVEVLAVLRDATVEKAKEAAAAE